MHRLPLYSRSRTSFLARTSAPQKMPPRAGYDAGILPPHPPLNFRAIRTTHGGDARSGQSHGNGCRHSRRWHIQGFFLLLVLAFLTVCVSCTTVSLQSCNHESRAGCCRESTIAFSDHSSALSCHSCTIAGAGERRDGDRERSPLKKSGSSTGSLNDNGSDDEIDEDSESQQMIV